MYMQSNEAINKKEDTVWAGGLIGATVGGGIIGATGLGLGASLKAKNKNLTEAKDKFKADKLKGDFDGEGGLEKQVKMENEIKGLSQSKSSVRKPHSMLFGSTARKSITGGASILLGAGTGMLIDANND